MANFYQEGYDEPGITTELPTDHVLEGFLATNFKGSPKDFSYHIDIFKSLGLKPGNKLLDFGANWGYATYQFKKAGFDTDAFELSRPRAAFGKKLGVEISTKYPEMNGEYDMVYSCHVLEHVPNPLESIQKMLEMVKVGGLVVGHTPNGSPSFRKKNPKLFHRTWGRVHPVLLSDQFVSTNFGGHQVYVSSDDRPATVGKWDKKTRLIGSTDSNGFFFAIVKS
jgi:SAM-dependent methyltransferase